MNEELGKLKNGYRRAIEKAMERVPVRNGVIALRDLWLETSLPQDLLVEMLQENGFRMPPHVERVDLDTNRGKRDARKRK
ncbi:MAG: hypothetical protein R6U88_00085 [Candidatus Bipolaricaulota bacterium]